MGAPSIVFKCQATTEPGRYYAKTHVIDRGGAALIALGQQKAWQIGVHRNSHRLSFEYEGEKVPFLIPACQAKYLPDFRLGNVILESKGWFGKGAKERQKLVFVRDSNPGLDIRLVFSDAN
jgi:hypothetical protein